MKKYNVAIIGVGVVGIEMLRCLKERSFPVNRLSIFARSARDIKIDSETYAVKAISSCYFEDIDIALFAGTEGEKGASVLYAHKFIEKKAVVIDNGSDFRLKEDVPLIVPEVNKDKISTHKGLIANPNCTTIQAVVSLGGIYKEFGLERFLLVSFQATSGAGKEAAVSLWEEAKNIVNKNKDVDYEQLDKKTDKIPSVFSAQIAFNVIPQIGNVEEDNYTTEEWKVVRETHKILADSSIKITATCVRVPVFTSHAEAIYFRPRKKVTLSDLEKALNSSAGVKYFPHQSPFPLEAEGKDEVFVGRLRRDPYEENSFWLWCVSDNLRKGAALNAIQIAEHLIEVTSILPSFT